MERTQPLAESSIGRRIEELEQEYGAPAVGEFCLRRYWIAPLGALAERSEDEAAEEEGIPPDFRPRAEQEILEQALQLIQVDNSRFMADATERLEGIARLYNENTYLDSISPNATEALVVRKRIYDSAIELYNNVAYYARERRACEEPMSSIRWPGHMTMTAFLLLLDELTKAVRFSERFLGQRVGGGRKSMHSAIYGSPKQALVSSCVDLFQESGRMPTTVANEGLHAFVLLVAEYATGKPHEDSQFLTAIREFVLRQRKLDAWEAARLNFHNLGLPEEARRYEKLISEARRRIPGGGIFLPGG